MDESQADALDRRVLPEQGDTSESTAHLVANAFTTPAGRLEDVLGRTKRTTPPVEPKVTGEAEVNIAEVSAAEVSVVEVRVIALACTQPPEGRPRWTLRLLDKHPAVTEGYRRWTTPRSGGS